MGSQWTGSGPGTSWLALPAFSGLAQNVCCIQRADARLPAPPQLELDAVIVSERCVMLVVVKGALSAAAVEKQADRALQKIRCGKAGRCEKAREGAETRGKALGMGTVVLLVLLVQVGGACEAQVTFMQAGTFPFRLGAPACGCREHHLLLSPCDQGWGSSTPPLTHKLHAPPCSALVENDPHGADAAVFRGKEIKVALAGTYIAAQERGPLQELADKRGWPVFLPGGATLSQRDGCFLPGAGPRSRTVEDDFPSDGVGGTTSTTALAAVPFHVLRTERPGPCSGSDIAPLIRHLHPLIGSRVVQRRGLSNRPAVLRAKIVG